MHRLSGNSSKSYSSLILRASVEKHIFFRTARIFFCGPLQHQSRPSRTSNSLFLIKKGETETLQDFMVRFNAATLEIKDLNEDMAISIMKRDLRESRLTYSLDKTLSRTYAELLKRTYKYMHADEGASDQRQTEGKNQKKKQKKSGAPVESSRPPSNKRVSPQQRSPRPTYNRYDSYTSLSASRAQILMEIERAGYLRYLPPMKAPLRNHDRKKYCWFHHDHSHDTEQYIQLRDEIETLIR